MKTNEKILKPDILLEKADEAPVLFTVFENKVSKYGENGVYCFIENYDMPYFSSPISNNMEKEWTSVRCCGKEKVLEVYYYLKDLTIYKKYAKRFFVDADFDNNSSLPNDIYVTPGYSIENFYVREECIRKILESEYEIDPIEDKELFEKTISLYRDRFRQFHQSVVKINAWYACLYVNPNWNRKDVCLGKRFPKKLMSYNINSEIIASYTLEDIELLFPKAPIIDRKLVETKEAELLENPSKMRGKYEIEFLIKFIKFLNADAGKKSREYTKKRKNFTFNDDIVLTALAAYSYVPDSLKSYIRLGRRTS